MFDVSMEPSLFLLKSVQTIDIFVDDFQDICRCNIKHFERHMWMSLQKSLDIFAYILTGVGKYLCEHCWMFANKIHNILTPQV